jgi:MinD superfamily P-loop ATPase
VDELVVISGKGGTGKTSIVASLAALARGAVVADCDVDAADLHLVLAGEDVQRRDFHGGRLAVIRAEDCRGCDLCRRVCRFEAIVPHRGLLRVDPTLCEGCGLCVRLCPAAAVDFPRRRSGIWMVRRTRVGPLVHARLFGAAENSGKLVTRVREEARRIAEREGRSLVLVDGPPGIGCPVIASVTGAARALVVTEPTVSGAHDLERALELLAHLGVPAMVCVNKWDLCEPAALAVEERARGMGARVVGRIRYDPVFTRAQVREQAVVELGGAAAGDLRRLWRAVRDAAGTRDACIP